MGFKPMYKLMSVLSVLVGLLFSNLASAAAITCPSPGVIEQQDQQIIPFVQGDSYCANIIVGGSKIWSSGFEVTNPGDYFDLTVVTGSGLIGYLEYIVSNTLNGVGGTTFEVGVLSANEEITLSFKAPDNVSLTDPDIVVFSFRALDMPDNTSIDSTSVVPVPAAVWLFGSGLLGLIGVARRRKV